MTEDERSVQRLTRRNNAIYGQRARAYDRKAKLSVVAIPLAFGAPIPSLLSLLPGLEWLMTLTWIMLGWAVLLLLAAFLYPVPRRVRGRVMKLGWLPRVLCRIGSHGGDRQVYQWHGIDPEVGAYTKWQVNCGRCTRVLESGVIEGEAR